MEHLNDDLSQAQIALNEAKTHEQEAIVDCQRTLKVFKFKEGYEHGKCGASLKYLIDIGFFLKVKVRILLKAVLPMLLGGGLSKCCV